MSATSTYKRLSSRNISGSLASPLSPVSPDDHDAGLQSGIQDVEGDPSKVEAFKRHARNREWWRFPVMVLLLVGTIMMIWARHNLITSVIRDEDADGTSGAGSVDDTGLGFSPGTLSTKISSGGASLWSAAVDIWQGSSDGQEGQGEVLAEMVEEELRDNAVVSEELLRASIEDSSDPGPEDGAPDQIMIEDDSESARAKMSLENVSTSVNWDEMLAQAPTRKAQVLREWGIDMDAPFRSLEEFKALIGNTCPALRHCSIKHRTNLFFGGGDWVKSSGSLSFNPYNCWMYNFDGREPWSQPSSEQAQRLVVFLDSDKSRSVFAEAAQKRDFFRYLEAPAPVTLDAERALKARILDLVNEVLGGAGAVEPSAEEASAEESERNVDLTLVVNWIRPGHEPGLAKALQRIGTGHNVRSVEVVWTTQPFYSLKSLTEGVKTNEAMAREIKRVHKEGASSFLSKRAPIKLWQRNPASESNVRLLIGAKELLNKAKDIALFDVRMDYKPFPQEHLSWFYNHGVNLPLHKLQNGWVPNLPPSTQIVVYCQTGFNANKAVRLLRLYGFPNARAISLGTVRAAEFRNRRVEVANPIRLKENVNLRGLDLFAPSIGLPDEHVQRQGGAAPGSHSLVADFLSNSLLNLVFKNEIVASASDMHEHKANHVCGIAEDACTSCFAVTGSIPSDRINFALLKFYLPQRSVPTKILLVKEHRIWEGDWVSFLENNKNTALTVRKNYAQVRTRRFEKQALPMYLQHANIVRQDEDGSFIETNEAPNNVEKDPSGLPIYAGNNKLDKFSMAEYNFKYPEWIRRNSLQRPAMWLGPKGSLSSLHVDHSNRGNLAYQVLGKKKWHLMPPKNRPFLYGRKVGVVIWSALIDPNLYDEAKEQELPLFKLGLCESVQIEVNAGELLYNPDEWWHVVYNQEASLMLNFWIKASLPLMPPQQQKVDA